MECNTVDLGQSLVATAELSGTQVVVRIVNNAPDAIWRSVQVTDPTGATVASVDLPGQGTRDTLVVTLDLDPATSTTGSFTVSGELRGFDDAICSFSRTFIFDIGDAGVTVSLLLKDHLPLAARQQAEIVMGNRGRRTVDLTPRTRYRGAWTAEWRVTDGFVEAIESTSRDSVRWHLPDAIGVYQVELVMDYGVDGLAVDALAVEVV